MGEAIAKTSRTRLKEIRANMLGYYGVLRDGAAALALDNDSALSTAFAAANLRVGGFCTLRTDGNALGKGKSNGPANANGQGNGNGGHETVEISATEHELLWLAWESWTTLHDCISLPIPGIFAFYFLEQQPPHLRARFLCILEQYRAATAPLYRTISSTKYFDSVEERGVWERMLQTELEPSLHKWVAIREIFEGEKLGNRLAQDRKLAPVSHPLPPRPVAPQVGSFAPRISSSTAQTPRLPFQIVATPTSTGPASTEGALKVGEDRAIQQPLSRLPQAQPPVPSHNSLPPPTAPRQQFVPPTFQPPPGPHSAPLPPPRQSVQQSSHRQHGLQATPLPAPHFDNTNASALLQLQQQDTDQRAIDALNSTLAAAAEKKRLQSEAKKLVSSKKRSDKKAVDNRNFGIVSRAFWDQVKAPASAVESNGVVAASSSVPEVGGIASGSKDVGDGRRQTGAPDAVAVWRGAEMVSEILSSRDTPPSAQVNPSDFLKIGDLTAQVTSSDAAQVDQPPPPPPPPPAPASSSRPLHAPSGTTPLPPTEASVALQLSTPIAAPPLAFSFTISPPAIRSVATAPHPPLQRSPIVPARAKTALSVAPALPPSQIYSRDVFRPPPSLPAGPFSRPIPIPTTATKKEPTAPTPAPTPIQQNVPHSFTPTTAPPRVSTAPQPSILSPFPASLKSPAAAAAPDKPIDPLKSKSKSPPVSLARTLPVKILSAAPQVIAPVLEPVASTRGGDVEMESDGLVATASVKQVIAKPKLTGAQLISLASPRAATVLPWERRQSSPTQAASISPSAQAKVASISAKPVKSTPSTSSTPAALRATSPNSIAPAIALLSPQDSPAPVPLPLPPRSLENSSKKGVSDAAAVATAAVATAAQGGLAGSNSPTHTDESAPMLPPQVKAISSAVKSAVAAIPQKCTNPAVAMPARPPLPAAAPPLESGPSAAPSPIVPRTDSLPARPPILPTPPPIAPPPATPSAAAVPSPSIQPHSPALRVGTPATTTTANGTTPIKSPHSSSEKDAPVAGPAAERAPSTQIAHGLIPQIPTPIVVPQGRVSAPMVNCLVGAGDTPNSAPKAKIRHASLVPKRIVVPPAGPSPAKVAPVGPPDRVNVAVVASESKGKVSRKLSISSIDKSRPIKKRKPEYHHPITVQITPTASLVFDTPPPARKRSKSRPREASVVL